MRTIASLIALLCLTGPAYAQPAGSEKCTACVDGCPSWDPECGNLGVQWCGLWQNDDWISGTLTALQCVNCPAFDPECHPYKAKPHTAPAKYAPYCTECETNCPAWDPECGNPGTQWCGLADFEEQVWVENTPQLYSCRL